LKSGFGNTGGNNLQISDSGRMLRQLICHEGGESMIEEPPIAYASIVASPAFASANVAMGVCRTTDDLRAILRAR
jgi:hypothetical protein